MGFKIEFSTGKKIRLPDIEVQELIYKFLNMDMLLMENDLKEIEYPVIKRYKEMNQ